MTSAMYATERIPLSKIMNIRNLTEKDFSELFKDEKNKKGEYRKFTRYIENAMKAKGITKHLYTYSQRTPNGMSGRLHSGTSIQGIKKGIRGYLFNHTTDLDMENAHPVLLKYICKIHNISCPHLSHFVENRDTYYGMSGLSRSEAKSLLLKMVNSNKRTNGLCDELKKLDVECKNIQNQLTKIKEYHDIHEVALEFARRDNVEGSFINRVLCKYENDVLQIAVDYLQGQGKEITAYMYDGCMGDGEVSDTDLDKINKLVNEKFEGMNMKFVRKEHPNIITDDYLTTLPPKEVELPDEITMIEEVVDKYPYFYKCKKDVYMFDTKTGLYVTDKSVHQKKIIDILREDYGTISLSNNKVSALYCQLLRFIPNDDLWLDKIADSGCRCLLFRNGYYDFTKLQFIDKFNPNIFFKWGYDFDFEEFKDTDLMNQIKHQFFTLPLGEEDGDKYLELLCRAYAGDYMKYIIMSVGIGDSGKSFITAMLSAGLGGDAVKIFNAHSFIYRPNAQQEEAQRNRWALQARFARIAISQEIDDKAEIDGNYLKKMSAGNDKLVGRNHSEGEQEFYPHFKTFIAGNEQPPIKPQDDAVMNRIQQFFWGKKFCMKPNPNNPNELQADDSLKSKFNNISFRLSLINLFINRYKLFIEIGEKPKTESMKQAESAILGTEENEHDKIVNEWLEQYEITTDETDWVSAKDMKKFCENKKYSIAKLTLSIKKYSCLNSTPSPSFGKQIKQNGKNVTIWRGVKERDEEQDPTDT